MRQNCTVAISNYTLVPHPIYHYHTLLSVPSRVGSPPGAVHSLLEFRPLAPAILPDTSPTTASVPLLLD